MSIANNYYRLAQSLKAERDEAKAAFASAIHRWNKLSDQLEVVTDDNAALRRSLAEMRAERDALRNELATLRVAATPRPAGDDSQYEETAYGWRRITPKKFAELNELVDRADPFDGGCAHDCADRR